MVITEIIDESKSIINLLKHYYGDEIKCNYCGKSMLVGKFSNGKTFKCSCGKKLNWKTGTLFQGSRLKASELLMIKYFLEKQMEVKDIANELNLTVDTVKLWKFKFENI